MIVVLGCRLNFEPDSTRLRGASLRRVLAAAQAYRDHTRMRDRGGASIERDQVVITSGGRAWSGVVEADALARELEHRGVPGALILRERWSHSTRENARYVAELLRPRGVLAITIVTCDFHVPRASFLFEHEGFAVKAVPAPSPPHRPLSFRAMYGRWRELLATKIDRRFIAGASR